MQTGSQGKPLHNGKLPQQHGVQHHIAGQHYGEAKLPRHQRGPHERRRLHEHEQTRRSQKEGQKMLLR